METVVIVGGAGDIGRHICLAAIEKGYDVLAIGRNADAMRIPELEGARLLTCDISGDDAIATIRGALENPVRAVIHGPGVDTAGGVLTAPISAVIDAANIKAGGMMRLVRACEDFFIEGTRLIGIGGHYGFEPTAYAATAGIGNAALANLIKQYSIAFGEKGVTAHLVAPGPADTARLHRVANARAERAGQSVDTVLAEMRSESSIGEFTDVSAVAWAVMSLLSPHASAMTGSTLFLDAGRRHGI